jgi:glycosyl transferase family 25
MKAYLINLDRSPERLAFMQAQFDALGLEVERVPGIDGRGNIPERWRLQFQCGPLTSGEAACYASHLLVAEKLLASDQPCALVLEDDAEFLTGTAFFEVTEAAVKAAPAGWHMLHLTSGFKRIPHRVCKLGAHHWLVRHSRLPAGSAGYILSRAGAAKLLKFRMRVRPIDMEFRYAWVIGFDLYGIHPMLIDQDHAKFSTTIDSTWRTDPPVKHKFAPRKLSRLYGWAFVRYKLGLYGSLKCWILNLHRSANKRIYNIRNKAPRGT